MQKKPKNKESRIKRFLKPNKTLNRKLKKRKPMLPIKLMLLKPELSQLKQRLHKTRRMSKRNYRMLLLRLKRML